MPKKDVQKNDVTASETGLRLQDIGEVPISELKKDRGSLALLVNHYNQLIKKIPIYEKYNEERIKLQSENNYLKKNKKINVAIVISIGIISSLITAAMNNFSILVPLAIVIAALVFVYLFIEFGQKGEKNGK